MIYLIEDCGKTRSFFMPLPFPTMSNEWYATVQLLESLPIIKLYALHELLTDYSSLILLTIFCRRNIRFQRAIIGLNKGLRYICSSSEPCKPSFKNEKIFLRKKRFNRNDQLVLPGNDHCCRHPTISMGSRCICSSIQLFYRITLPQSQGK